MTFVPRPNQGPIVHVDRSRLPRKGGQSMPRILYYFVTILTDKWMQTQGVTIVRVASSRNSRSPEMSLDKQIVAMPMQGLPFRVKSFSVALSYELGREILVDTFGYNEARHVQFLQGVTPERISSDSVRGVLQSMHNKGIELDKVPQELG